MLKIENGYGKTISTIRQICNGERTQSGILNGKSFFPYLLNLNQKFMIARAMFYIIVCFISAIAYTLQP